jgi:hypothetical protein
MVSSKTTLMVTSRTASLKAMSRVKMEKNNGKYNESTAGSSHDGGEPESE